jgi:hypothetical protein
MKPKLAIVTELAGKLDSKPKTALERFDPDSIAQWTPRTAQDAITLQSRAARHRAYAGDLREHGHQLDAFMEDGRAQKLEEAVADFLEPVSHVTGPLKVGNGGELIAATAEAQANIPGVIDTVRQSPNMLTAYASRARLEMLSPTGDAITLAVDTAESIQPKNSLEKMLAHQAASLHRTMMLFGNEANRLLERVVFITSTNRHQDFLASQPLSVEACRLLNASTRAATAYQNAMLTLDRIRRGGKQTVRVVHVHEQHVSVGAGGQAVVAGTVKGGGTRGQSTRGGRKNGR